MSIFVFRRRELLLWAIATLFFGISGPFGSFVYLDWSSRFLYWGTQIAGAIILGALIELLVTNFFGKIKSLWRDAISVVVMTVLFTPVVYYVNYWYFPAEILVYIGTMTVAVGVFCVTAFAIMSWRYVHTLNALNEVKENGPKLLQRLDDDLGDIYALTANSHLVEVACEQGVQTIRFRFSDAVEEMKPVDGVLVHRSHWICRSHIDSFFYEGKKLMVRLDNGSSYPVSANGRVNLTRLGIEIPDA